MTRRFLILMLICALCLAAFPLQAFAQTSQTNQKLIALTFDDGPCKDTERLLSALRTRKVKVTFFMLGTRAYTYPEIVKQAYEDGHQIANHSNGHPMLTRLTDQQIKDQISYTDNHLNNAIGGVTDYLVRPPYGDSNQRVMDQIGRPLIFWSVDSNDWRWTNDAAKTTSEILRLAFDGAIILVHDIHTWSVSGALNAIDKLRADGYEFVTVSELFRRRGQTLEPYNRYNMCTPTGIQLPAISTPVITSELVGNTTYLKISADPGTRIYYTTDGSIPNPSSKEYTGPVAFEGDISVTAVAGYDMNGSRSSTAKASLSAVPKEAAPEVSISDKGRVKIKGSGMIHVSTDGSYPLQGDTLYSGPFTVEPGTVVKAAVPASSNKKMYSDTISLCYSKLRHVYSDVFPDDWYYPYLDSAFDKGILSGVEKTVMAPDNTLTRGMLVAILYRISGKPAVSLSGSSAFTDVYDSKYYSEAAVWAKENKVVSGYADGTFRPNNPISREQLAAMLCNYSKNWLKKEIPVQPVPSKYKDENAVAAYAQESVRWAINEGLLGDYKTSILDPGKPASRAMTAAMLYHLFEE